MEQRDEGSQGLAGQRDHELLSLMSRSAPHAIVVIDAERRVLTWNPAAERIFGWSEREVVGRSLPMVSAELLEESKWIEGRVKSGEFIAGIEMTRVRKDGAHVPVRLAVSPLVDAGFNYVGAILIYEDLTEIGRVRDQFLQCQRLESLGRLAGGIAHDFNNLLTVINGYSRLLLSQSLSGDRFNEPLAMIVKAGERAAELTRQLLAFSREHVLVPGFVDVNAVITETMDLLRSTAGDGIKIVARLDPQLRGIRADRALIRQAILNLAANARGAMPEGGDLLLETSNLEVDGTFAAHHADTRPGSYVMLTVTDTGRGMDETARQHAFEPFFANRATQSAGLGLAAVYGIAKQHGGFVWLNSEAGKGSTFNFCLPAAAPGANLDVPDVLSAGRSKPDSPPAPVPDAQKTLPSDVPRRTVLVVDDEPEIRRLFALVLSQAGFETLAASNGREALESVRNRPIDLVLCDLVMPEKEGLETIKQLRVSYPYMKVIAISGAFGGSFLRAARLLGASATLCKPVSPEKLVKAVQEALGAD